MATTVGTSWRFRCAVFNRVTADIVRSSAMECGTDEYNLIATAFQKTEPIRPRTFHRMDCAAYCQNPPTRWSFQGLPPIKWVLVQSKRNQKQLNPLSICGELNFIDFCKKLRPVFPADQERVDAMIDLRDKQGMKICPHFLECFQVLDTWWNLRWHLGWYVLRTSNV